MRSSDIVDAIRVISLGKRYIARGGGTVGSTAQPSNDVAHGQLSGAGIQVFLSWQGGNSWRY
jgi:hypothetical protein